MTARDFLMTLTKTEQEAFATNLRIRERSLPSFRHDLLEQIKETGGAYRLCRVASQSIHD